MELTKIIAANITRLLEEHNHTQSELSAHLEISRQTLSNYLKGTSTIDTVRLVKTAQFFNVPVSSLLESQRPFRSPILLRADINAHDPIDRIESMVFDYLDRYEHLSAQFGLSSRFLPEQHNLYIEHRGEKLSINHELLKVPPVKFRVTDQLRREIYHIADSQRRLLGLNDSGAIELITALTQRGIKVFFLNFQSENIFGLSICDNIYGCCIFVNSHPSISIERQLFTVAHEFAHIILHRPLFSPGTNVLLSPQYSALLDDMANEFAGRLLCPPEAIYPYISFLNSPDATLRSIVPIAIRLKQKLHISLQALLVTLNHQGIISRSITREYFSILDDTKTRKQEPVPISEEKSLKERFENARDNHLIELLRHVHMNSPVSPDTISYFLNCSRQKATQILRKFNSDMDEFSEFI